MILRILVWGLRRLAYLVIAFAIGYTAGVAATEAALDHSVVLT